MNKMNVRASRVPKQAATVLPSVSTTILSIGPHAVEIAISYLAAMEPRLPKRFITPAGNRFAFFASNNLANTPWVLYMMMEMNNA
jgi:hypothetical protein